LLFPFFFFFGFTEAPASVSCSTAEVVVSPPKLPGTTVGNDTIVGLVTSDLDFPPEEVEGSDPGTLISVSSVALVSTSLVATGFFFDFFFRVLDCFDFSFGKGSNESGEGSRIWLE
jgi:hypothetical protein